MQTKSHMRQALQMSAVLAAAAWAATVSIAADPVSMQDTGGIDLKVIAAWEKAGARFGWVSHHAWGGDLKYTRARPNDVKALPAFQVGTMKLPPAQELPLPTVSSDPEVGKVVIDVMKSVQPLHREGLKHTKAVESEGLRYRIPTLEMALALKFGPMVSPNRADEKKYKDASDFISMVKTNPDLNLDLLAELGELVYPGGGKEIVEIVRKIRAGEKLTL